MRPFPPFFLRWRNPPRTNWCLTLTFVLERVDPIVSYSLIHQVKGRLGYLGLLFFWQAEEEGEGEGEVEGEEEEEEETCSYFFFCVISQYRLTFYIWLFHRQCRCWWNQIQFFI